MADSQITPSAPPFYFGEHLAQLKFSEAGPAWLDSRVKIGPRTRADYKQYIAALAKFFGEMQLSDIDIRHVREYQNQRQQAIEGKWEGAGPVRINHELCALILVLKRANLWGKFEGIYEALAVPSWKPPRAITNEEEQRLYQVANSRPEWKMLYAYTVFANNTGLRGCEMRALRLADIDLIAGTVSICRTLKTKRSLRKIPLVPAAKWAAENLMAIASSKGAALPHHCLFPKRVHRKLWNPDEPMCTTAIGKPWRAMRDAAGLPHLRPHDLRHQVNTKLAESGADDYTITSIMGHQGRQMTEWYSSIREQHKRVVLEKALGGAR